MSSKDLVAASAKTIILSLLLAGESYGYQIIKRVRSVSGGELEWSNAVLYPVLHKMERDGLVRSEWRMSPENRMRKYYMLTELGATSAIPSGRGRPAPCGPEVRSWWTVQGPRSGRDP